MWLNSSYQVKAGSEQGLSFICVTHMCFAWSQVNNFLQLGQKKKNQVVDLKQFLDENKQNT